MSVFEEDRNIITQTMVMRVMEHENFIDKSNLAFFHLLRIKAFDNNIQLKKDNLLNYQ